MLEIFSKKIEKKEVSENTQKIGGRKLSGVVVSDKMKKTVVVAVSYEKKHSKYKKYFRVTKRMKAHDENGEYHTGDNVIIQETRPISKEKRWRVISKV